MDIPSVASAVTVPPQPLDMQTLPMQQQEALHLNGVLEQKLEQAGASLRDKPVLQVQEPLTSETPDFKQMLLNKVVAMDQGYHAMLNEFAHMPNFSEAVAEARKDAPSTAIRTYPETTAGSGLDQSLAAVKQATLDSAQMLQSSSIYNRMVAQWGMKNQLWMTNMNIVTSAVSQVAQGFKALFRMSG